MKALVKVRDWIGRHRRFAILLSVLFVIFEITRVVEIGQLFLPGWSGAFSAEVQELLSRPPWIVATTALLAVAFFAVPMAGAIYAALRIRRRVSRYWTGVKRQG